ncbi:MAG: TRAM domain-containing protein [Dehalococcoidia bacterium]
MKYITGLKNISSAAVFRGLGAVVLGLAGWALATYINSLNPPMEGPFWVILLSVLGADIGLGFIVPPQGLRIAIKRIPGYAVFSALVGLIVAVVLSAILALPFSLLSDDLAKIIPAIVFIILAYFSITLMILRSQDVSQFFGLLAPLAGRPGRSGLEKVVLDTNSIIDGRIADIAATGFVQGTMIIPRFVLRELQYIADSEDSLRRARGKRGLDVLARLHEEKGVSIRILDMDFPEIREVDAKLVKLARNLRCPIITNDINLSRIAAIEGVRALNVNELAHALKPVVMSGEEMKLKISHEGKEAGQGIGYLDDGTMVVVEGGRDYINSEVTVTVSRVLQTASGKMIFANPGARK